MSVALYLALAIAPAVVLAIADGVRQWTEARSQLDDLLIERNEARAKRGLDALADLRGSVHVLSRVAFIDGFDEGRCGATLAAAVEADPRLAFAIATSPDGRIVCASHRVMVGQRAPMADRFAGEDAGRGTLLTVASGEEGDVWAALAAAPRMRDGAVDGYVAAALPVAHLGVFDGGRPERDGFLYRAVVDREGTVVASDPASVGTPEAVSSAAFAAARRAPVVIQQDEGGAALTVAAAPLLDDLWVVTAADADALYAEAEATAAWRIAPPFMMLLIALGVAYFSIDRLVVRHLLQFRRVARAYGRGRLDLEPAVGAHAPQEIRDLAGDLSEMAGRLGSRQGALRESAEANRLLLLEVHHRVKNNLQMIASLLNLQARRASSRVEQQALDRVRSRVHALSLVHERLYQSEHLERVPLHALLRAIAEALAHSARAPGRAGARLEVDIDEIVADPDRATPLALFANECLTNAFKHAEGGAVRVSLKRREDGGLVLRIVNTTRGASADHGDATRREGGLGAKLIESFARQLGGTLTWAVDDDAYAVELDVPAGERKIALSA